MTDHLTKGERTSQAILEAAYSLFVEQGYHATSMRQIARRAGVALGGIYNHFASKEQIFSQVLLEQHPYRQVLEILQSAPGETAEAFVHNAARTALEELGKRPDFLKLGFIEFSEFKGAHAPLLFQTIFPQFLPLMQRFRGDQGQLRELPLQTIMLSFLGMLFSYYMYYHLAALMTTPGGSLVPEADAMEQFLDIFLYGILQPEKP